MKTIKKVVYLGMIAGLITSCGSKNKTSSSTSSNSVNTVITNSQDASVFNQLKAQYQCSSYYGSNGSRIDYALEVQGQGYGDRVFGNLVQASGSAGSSAGGYMGINIGTKNLIYVNKITNGSNVTYRVLLSFCPYSGQNGNQWIGGNAQLGNFAIDAQLPSYSNCAMGEVNGMVRFYSSGFGGYLTSNYSAVGCY